MQFIKPHGQGDGFKLIQGHVLSIFNSYNQILFMIFLHIKINIVMPLVIVFIFIVYTNMDGLKVVQKENPKTKRYIFLKHQQRNRMY